MEYIQDCSSQIGHQLFDQKLKVMENHLKMLWKR